MFRSAVSLAALAAAVAFPAAADTVKITSPNGRVAVDLTYDQGGLGYDVTLDGKPLITPSALGVNTSAGTLGAGAQTLTGRNDKAVDETYHMVVGKAKDVADRYNETILTFDQNGPNPLHYSVVVRAYDTGTAVRFLLDDQKGALKDITVSGERTRYNFAADYTCWGANQGRFVNSHEGEFDPVKSSQIRNFHLFDAPLVCKTGQGDTTFALAEADTRHYPAAWFTGRGDGGFGVEPVLTPRADDDPGARQVTIAARIDLTAKPFAMPWRVVMVGDHPSDLTQSTLIPQLGAPSEIADTSWIKAGKAAWDWWNDWDVNVAHPGINTESYKAYTDFAVQMNAQYILIDEGWSVGSSTEPNPKADLTKTIPAIDMPAIVAYAKSKGIGVWVWAQWQQLDAQMDAALTQYEAWGLKGIKVDFINRSDQQAVDYYDKLMRKAAEHHLMVDLHGAYAPNGLLRTFPNYVTQEGVMGAEYNKWSARITATHNVTLPFTRMILGPMDYTPGGFHNATPATFVARNHKPMVQTTRGQAVAMYVVYDSPFMMIADGPGAYRNSDGSWADGADFIRQVPVTWDETRVLAGDIGQYIVTARRSGDTWYIGAMTNEQGRTIAIPLNFLKSGNYSAHLWQDGRDPTHLSVSDTTIDNGESLSLVLAPSGGAAVVLTPQASGHAKTKRK